MAFYCRALHGMCRKMVLLPGLFAGLFFPRGARRGQMQKQGRTAANIIVHESHKGLQPSGPAATGHADGADLVTYTTDPPDAGFHYDRAPAGNILMGFAEPHQFLVT